MGKTLLFAYNTLYPVGGLLLSPYIAYRLARYKKHRAGLWEKLSFKLPPRLPHNRRIWFHAVSVGESLAVAPVVSLFKERHPDVGIYFSTTTATGMEVAKRKLSGVVDAFFFFPLDFYPVVKRVVEVVSPTACAIVETEIWPSLAFAVEAPLFMINARISEHSFYGYMKLSFFIKELFKRYRRFLARSRKDAARLVALGAPQEKVEVAGNIKFYSVYQQSLGVDEERWRRELGLSEDAPVFVAGSTHQGEEEQVLKAYKVLKGKYPNLKLVLAPRHPERADEVEGLIKEFRLSCGRRSRGEKLKEADVLLLDTVGELFPTYSVCNVAFVGGSLVDVGGHNPLEPLAFERPTIMGPFYSNFLDVMEEVEGFVKVVKDWEGLVAAVEDALEGGGRLKGVKYKFLQADRAVEKTISALEEVL